MTRHAPQLNAIQAGREGVYNKYFTDHDLLIAARSFDISPNYQFSRGQSMRIFHTLIVTLTELRDVKRSLRAALDALERGRAGDEKGAGTVDRLV